MHFLCLIMLFLLTACGGGGGSFDAAIPLPSNKPTSVIVNYGSQDQQYGVLKLPEGNGPFPLAVLVHGGCWDRFNASLGIMQPMADTLTRAGWATLNLEYRVSSDAGYQVPMTFLDIASAMDSLPQMLASFPVNLKRTVLIGHSAGGHLALWAASRSSIPATSVLYKAKPNLPQAVIGLAAIPDLVAYRADSRSCGSLIPTLRGNLTDAEVSPQAMSSSVPTHLFLAALDSIVRPQYAYTYEQRQMNLGHIASVTTISGNHFTLIQSYGTIIDELLKKMDSTPVVP